MKSPIVQPELSFDMERFSIRSSIWAIWKDLLTEFGCHIEIESRQFLEDCLKNTTYLIAEQGKIGFSELEFNFVAQLDVKGYALYVSGDLRKNKTLEKLLKFVEIELSA